MDQLVEKIEKDIEREVDKKQKLEEKLKSCNEKIKQLQQKKTELEDSQMLASIKEFNVSPQELKELLLSIKGKGKADVKQISAENAVLEEEKAV